MDLDSQIFCSDVSGNVKKESVFGPKDKRVKVVTIVGARPQFIKAAPVSKIFKEAIDISEVIVHTGQHFDRSMSDIFFRDLEIPVPKYNLSIGGGSHGENTGRMIEGLEKVLLLEAPDWVLVYGDTDSTLAGAIAAAKLHIPIAHVEAGLRSNNMKMPEEVNRRLTDHVSTIHFTPTKGAGANLLKEGFSQQSIVNVGDVMFDAAKMFGGDHVIGVDILSDLKIVSGEYILATVHRQENTDNPTRLAAIFDAFGQVNWPVVIPLHPRTRGRLEQVGIAMNDNIKLIEPLGYCELLTLQRHARLIATDSGGIQKEAYFQRVPCVTLRDETEWNELIEMGWNRLARPGIDDLPRILASDPKPGRDDLSPYGRGDSAVRIASVLRSFCK